MLTPNGRIGRASARRQSPRDQMYFWVGVQPVPPYSFGQAGRDPALLGQHLVPGSWSSLLERLARVLLGAQLGGIVLGDEGADLVAEGDVLGGKSRSITRASRAAGLRNVRERLTTA